MKQRYKVKTKAGIDLGGRIYPPGRTFDPRAEHEAWCEQAVRAGTLERVAEEPPAGDAGTSKK